MKYVLMEVVDIDDGCVMGYINIPAASIPGFKEVAENIEVELRPLQAETLEHSGELRDWWERQ